MPMYLIIIAAFVGVATLVGGVAMMFRGSSNSQAEDRLDVLAGLKSATAAKDNEPSLLAHPLDEKRKFFEVFLPKSASLKNFLAQADSSLDSSKFALVSILLAAFGALLCLFSPAPKAMAPVAAVFMGFTPLGFIWFKRKRRLAKFAKQLPEALELIGRALRAGHSLGAGMSLVADEMDDPIAKEFTRCYEEQNFGIPLDEALEDMTNRVPNLDLRFFATAVILQRQTGGDLAEILDKIGRLIRERFRIWGQIQALTGEGRISGIVLLALPPALFLTMWRLNPTYCRMLFEDPMGQQMLAVAVVMQILGAIVIKKIINIKV